MTDRYSARGLWLLLMGLVLGAGLTAWAAPLLPSRSPLTDEARSLVGLKRLNLNISQIPSGMAAARLSVRKIRDHWTVRLREAGFEVVRDPVAPSLNLLIIGGAEPGIPKGVGFAMLLELEQPVRIEGLDQTLRVPTYTKLFMGIETLQDAASLARIGLAEQINHFLDSTRQATQATTR